MTATRRSKLLVTGGLGFVGSHVVARMRNSFQVTVIDWDTGAAASRRSETLHQEGVRRYDGDIADMKTWEMIKAEQGKCDVVFHAAAQTAAQTSEGDPVRDFRTNALGTLLVAEFAKECGAGVINCNSIRVYDPDCADAAMAEHGAVSEQCPTVERTSQHIPPFALSKYTGEQYLRLYARKYGLRVISNRMSGIVGPAQDASAAHGWLTYLVRCAVTGQFYTVFGDGNQTRDALYVTDYVDLVEAQIRSFDSFAEEGLAIYNVGGGKTNELSLNQVIALLREKHGLHLDHTLDDPRPGEPKHYVSGLDKVRRKGWTPKHTDPEQIIAELVRWEESNREPER